MKLMKNDENAAYQMLRMTFSKFTDHKSPLFKELSILHLDDINNFLTLNKDIHKNITRSSSNVHSIQARTNY